SLGSALIELLPLTLDYGNARARFGGTGLAEGLPISFQDGVPILPIDIAGKRFRVSFASGEAAGALFMDEDTARGLPISGEPVPRAGNGAQGAEAALPVAVTVSGVPLTVRAVNWPSPRPGGLLGSRAMTGLSVTFDAAAHLGKVERSGLPPRSPTSPSVTKSSPTAPPSLRVIATTAERGRLLALPDCFGGQWLVGGLALPFSPGCWRPTNSFLPSGVESTTVISLSFGPVRKRFSVA